MFVHLYGKWLYSYKECDYMCLRVSESLGIFHNNICETDITFKKVLNMLLIKLINKC